MRNYIFHRKNNLLFTSEFPQIQVSRGGVWAGEEILQMFHFPSYNHLYNILSSVDLMCVYVRFSWFNFTTYVGFDPALDVYEATSWVNLQGT